jgi:CO/xanthine dehydrogenase FAD-binding subunit
MGTMGGSISFSDPAADYPPALIAAEAEIEVISIKGTRRVAAEEFFIDWYETALQSGEIVSAIHLPKADLNACGYHEKFARVEGDFATASVNVVLTMHANKCSLIRIAVGACGPTPIRSHEAEKFLTEHDLNEKNIFKAGELLAKNCDPIDDARASAAYRLKLVPQLLIRAIQNAKHNLKEADLA